MTHTLTITCTIDDAGKITAVTWTSSNLIRPGALGILFGIAQAETHLQALRSIESLGKADIAYALAFTKGAMAGQFQRDRLAGSEGEHCHITVNDFPADHPP